MNTLIKKEIRQYLPTAILAAVLIWGQLVTAMMPGLSPYISRTVCASLQSSSLIFVGLAGLFLGVGVFGTEINSGTLLLLLSQPIERRSIWNMKWRVWFSSLAVLIILPFLVCLGLAMNDPVAKYPGILNAFVDCCGAFYPVAIVLMAGISGGLCATLLFKNVAVAFGVAMTVPMAVLMPILFLAELFEWRVNQEAVIVSLMTVYSAAAYIWARRLLLKMEDTVWSVSDKPLTFDSAWLSIPARFLPKGAVISMLVKELKLYQVVVLMILILSFLHVLSLLLHSHHIVMGTILDSLRVLWILVPTLIGAMAISEERRLNTLESSLCLPLGKRTQWGIKLGVAFVLSFILGGGIPTLIDGAGALCGMRDFFGAQSYGEYFLGMVIASVVLCLIFFYSSSVARSVFQALGIGVSLCVVIMVTANMLQLYIKSGHLMSWVLMCLLTPTVLWLSWRNFTQSRVSGRMIRHNIGVLSGVLIAGCVLSLSFYYRVWELAGDLEPVHQGNKMSGSVQPKVYQTRMGFPIALASDGRLWVPTRGSTDYLFINPQNSESYIYEYPAIPKAGKFIESSNWVQLAVETAFRGSCSIMGLKNDGSLWFLSWDRYSVTNGMKQIPNRGLLGQSLKPNELELPEPVITRVDVEARWKSIVSDMPRFIALKTDGTLWQWQLHGRDELTGPVQFGTDRDWLDVYFSLNRFWGVKTNGEVWMWGGIREMDYKALEQVRLHDKDYMVKTPFNGTNWTGFYWDGRSCLGSNAKGEVYCWFSNGNHYWVFGDEIGNMSISQRKKYETQIIQYTGSKMWSCVANRWAAVSKDGGLYFKCKDSSRVFAKMSKYEDWVFLTESEEGYLSLAADGTIVKWGGIDRFARSGFADRSRKVDWSCNIFNNSK